MDDKDQLASIFPTHQVTLIFHCAEIDMDEEMLKFMQHSLALAMHQKLTPLASFYEALPPMTLDAEDVEEACTEWAK